jgi:hypothetical protein
MWLQVVYGVLELITLFIIWELLPEYRELGYVPLVFCARASASDAALAAGLSGLSPAPSQAPVGACPQARRAALARM